MESNSYAPTAPRRLSLEEYIREMYEEIHSGFNRYCAGRELGREATEGELFSHWNTHGGRDRFEHEHPW